MAYNKRKNPPGKGSLTGANAGGEGDRKSRLYSLLLANDLWVTTIFVVLETQQERMSGDLWVMKLLSFAMLLVGSRDWRATL